MRHMSRDLNQTWTKFLINTEQHQAHVKQSESDPVLILHWKNSSSVRRETQKQSDQRTSEESDTLMFPLQAKQGLPLKRSQLGFISNTLE